MNNVRVMRDYREPDRDEWDLHEARINVALRELVEAEPEETRFGLGCVAGCAQVGMRRARPARHDPGMPSEPIPGRGDHRCGPMSDG